MLTRRSLVVAVAALGGSVLLGACTSGDDTVGADGLPENGAQVSAPVFADAVAQPEVAVLDVRTPQEFAAGHLPQAQLIDVSAPDFTEKIASLDPDVAYAVYCRSGNRSQTAVEIMRDAGFSRVFDLAGGIGAWQSNGGEVVTG